MAHTTKLARDIDLRKQAHGRNTSTPRGVDQKTSIGKKLGENLSDEEFCNMVDSGELHCKAGAGIAGHGRACKTYEAARDSLWRKNGLTGIGDAAEVVAVALLERAGVTVSGRSNVADIVANGWNVEVKSTFAVPGKRGCHQLNISRLQLDNANWLLASIINPADERMGRTEESVEWIFAPMGVVAEYVNRYCPGQAARSSVVVPLTASAHKVFRSYRYTSAARLLNALPRKLR